MTQCFYLVGHCYVGDDFAMDKVFLQEKEAIKWGRRLATENSKYSTYLFKQEMTRNGKIKYVRQLEPFAKKGADNDIDKQITVNKEIKRVPYAEFEPFDWDDFATTIENAMCN